jgi:predicted DNA repair protein MutK
VHGAEHFHLTPIPHLLHDGAEAAGHAVPAASGAVTWIVNALGSAVVGLVIGGAVILLLMLINKLRGKEAAH